ncbi:MAG: hypothetical protein CO042_04585 [Parcubacteria group bacterium CG_4_9_14_0_2_um_filter_41_8]|nr:MAG: hypothetical protein COY02_01250 [Parcubacteria group bacterium CG_4_10_14_0_2_um_filter_41_6]PJC40285.1 MAG: hypothetical protein CO042_04585 [Parcubacteria group bacterium CG_4_9_14_0_2_um_filter_41_8]
MKKRKKLNCILSCVNDNKKVLSIIYIVLLVIMVGILGYSLGASNQSSIYSRSAIESSPARSQNVLGDRIAPFYANPFDSIDAEEVAFPLAQLRGCRNWEECQVLCSKPANFQECVAWEKSQE